MGFSKISALVFFQRSLAEKYLLFCSSGPFLLLEKNQDTFLPAKGPYKTKALSYRGGGSGKKRLEKILDFFARARPER